MRVRRGYGGHHYGLHVGLSEGSLHLVDRRLDLDLGRDGLLRSILDQQETRGLCRSDDLARMLPSEACLLAKGRTTAVAKRLFFSKFVQQSLLSYERDGWHQQPTRYTTYSI